MSNQASSAGRPDAAPTSASEFFESYLPAWFAQASNGKVTSPGSLVFHVGPDSHALRLDAGKLEVTRGATTDAILQVSLSPADFAALIREGATLLDSGDADRLLALRSLSLDPERAKAIRNVDGSVAFEVAESDGVRTLLLSPGAALAGASAPSCTVQIAGGDFWALSRGERNPFELLMEGKIHIQGRMEVAMALSSVLVG
ncbi:MAG TPA: SCP2 sterol-binding domain-containing protein [Polyangiaceae bacterium]|nr:SCP2 sterol-binding domain-containing protein [Polyangiaceae bacterium]